MEQLRVPLAGDTLARVHAEECATAAVLAAVGIAVDGFAAAGETLSGDVVLRRRSGEQIHLEALQRSVVLELVPGGPLPATLAVGEDELRLPVTVRPVTCDPHVLAETKQPFVFPLLVQVGDGEAVAVDLPLSGAQRAQLQELLGRVC
ncbi:hypothetical protein A7K94_0218430 [Modestobacter sp. VKM Ac-2676]|nr:hypothetical protein A7K94_0218430 [Modestobacter sp. VKM Ac-2676]